MGNVTSQNVTNALINAMVSISNKALQSSKYYGTCVNTINVGPGCSLSNVDITQTCVITIDQNFYSDVQFQNQINAQIQQELSQIAEAISQNISFNPSSTQASNIANAIVNVGVTISNTFAQSFAATLQQANTINLAKDCKLTQDVFEQTAMSNYMVNAMQKAYAASTEDLQLQQDISQSATAEQQNALLSLMIIIVAIVVMVIFTGGKIVQQLTAPPFLIMVIPVILALVYLFIAYAKSWPPFSCKST